MACNGPRKYFKHKNFTPKFYELLAVVKVLTPPCFFVPVRLQQQWRQLDFISLFAKRRCQTAVLTSPLVVPIGPTSRPRPQIWCKWGKGSCELTGGEERESVCVCERERERERKAVFCCHVRPFFPAGTHASGRAHARGPRYHRISPPRGEVPGTLFATFYHQKCASQLCS